MTTPNSGIPEVPEATLDPAAGLNLALRVIDALLQTAVIAMDLTAPPGSPADGDLYIVAVGGSGAWNDLDNYLVRYVAEGTFWQSFAPGSQVRLVLNKEDGLLYQFISMSPGGSWEVLAGSEEEGPTFPTVVTESGTSRTADPIDDAGTYIRFTNGSAKTFTFDAGETWPLGNEYHGRNSGAGDLTIVEGSGMQINPPVNGSLVILQHGTFTIKIVGNDEADLIGTTEAPP